MLWALMWVVLALAAVAVVGFLALRVWRRFWALADEVGEIAGRTAGALDEILDVVPAAGSSHDSSPTRPAQHSEAESGFTAARRVNTDQRT